MGLFTCSFSKCGILGRESREDIGKMSNEDVEVDAASGQVKTRERVLPSSSSSSPRTVVRLVGEGKLQKGRMSISGDSASKRKRSMTTNRLNRTSEFHNRGRIMVYSTLGAFLLE